MTLETPSPLAKTAHPPVHLAKGILTSSASTEPEFPEDTSEIEALKNVFLGESVLEALGAEHVILFFLLRITQEDIFRGFDLGSIFREFGFGGGGRGQNPFGQMYGGMGGFGQGGRCSQGHGQGTKGQNLIYELPMTLEELCQATDKTIAYQIEGRQEKVSVKVPAGIKGGQKLRLQGKGQPGMFGGPPGDLYVQIKELPHPAFRRENADLYVTREIAFSEAVLGTEIEVPTIEQKVLKLKIPPGTQDNAKFRLKGHGMPLNNGSGKGNAYLEIGIEVPKELTKEQESVMKSLNKVGL